MSDYPGEIDDHRSYENLPGLTYDPTETKNIFAEDMLNLWSAIIAIQETLGINPQGSFATVVARLDAGGGGGTKFLVTESGSHIIWSAGSRIKI